MGTYKQSLLPFVSKTLATAIMAAALGACSSNDNDSAREPTNVSDLPDQDPATEFYAPGEMSETGYTIELIQNCGVEPENAANSVVFSGETLENLQGGSGILENWGIAEAEVESEARPSNPWNNLANRPESAKYDLSSLPVDEDGSCNGVQTKTGILVTKYADWEHQHSNEFNPVLVDSNLTFGDLDSIVIEMKLNRQHSVIPTREQIEETYGDIINSYLEEGEEFDIDRLDQWKAVIAVSIQAEGYDNPNTTNISAERYIVIDQEEYFDQWIRITIPFETMDIFTGPVWEKDATTFEEQVSTSVGRLHIVGEILGAELDRPQGYGDVVRNYIGGISENADYNDLDIPETFKEMDITVKKMEVVIEDTEAAVEE